MSRDQLVSHSTLLHLNPTNIVSSALLIHGGGNCMFTRKEAHPRQIKILLAQGFIPVSVDYRFAPEINIIDGSMIDVCDALRWCRETLPTMQGLNSPEGLQMDGERVAVVGWSTGGHLAMTLGYTPRLQKGLRTPEAILALYCPSNYEADCKSLLYAINRQRIFLANI